MAKNRKRPVDAFDISQFLRSSDEDMKSALASILRDPIPEINTHSSDINPEPGLNLIPPLRLIHSGHSDFDNLQLKDIEERPDVTVDTHEIKSDSKIKSDPGIKLIPGSDLEIITDAGVLINSTGPESLREYDSGPGLNLDSGLNLTSDALLVDSSPSLITKSLAETHIPKKRNFPIREMKLAQDAHTRAEQQVYQSLWENGNVFDAGSRVITIGFGSMARLARLSESNARLNLRSLLVKLAVEEHREYNCEMSVGKTYRVFNYSEILRRRREAGLTHFMRRTLAVVFVDPLTGQIIDLKKGGFGFGKLGPGPKLRPEPGLSLTGEAGPNLIPPPDLNLTPGPPLNLGPLYREIKDRELKNRETTTSPTKPIAAATAAPALTAVTKSLRKFGMPDDEVATRLWNECRRTRPDCTEDEVAHFIREKGALISNQHSKITNPFGFLLSSVPKCLTGASFEEYRRQGRAREEAAEAGRARQRAEVEAIIEEQRQILKNPASSEEEKMMARKMLNINSN